MKPHGYCTDQHRLDLIQLKMIDYLLIMSESVVFDVQWCQMTNNPAQIDALITIDISNIVDSIDRHNGAAIDDDSYSRRISYASSIAKIDIFV